MVPEVWMTVLGELWLLHWNGLEDCFEFHRDGIFIELECEALHEARDFLKLYEMEYLGEL